MKARAWIGSILLLIGVAGVAAGLMAWKKSSIDQANAAAANQPEPMELVSTAVARQREHQPVNISIGTVVALRSVTLRNENPGTVRRVNLEPGQIVEKGTILVALDVSVEQAELKAQEAQAELANTQLKRLRNLHESQVISELEFDRARTEYDVAVAQIARIKAVIARKTIHAPFRARVGIADVHAGQFLEEGTVLTTLQGIDDAVHVDFTVTQRVAEVLPKDARVEVLTSQGAEPLVARVVATDARVDPETRNSAVRARLDNAPESITPGASVRVRVPVGHPIVATAVPVSAVRKGPAGDHVFMIEPDPKGTLRAQPRAVQIGAVLGDEVLIVDGLAPGERVATSGSFKLREGVQVAIANDEQAVQTAAAKQ